MLALVNQSLPMPENMLTGINYGFNNVRFLYPVRPEDSLHLLGTVGEVIEKEPSCLLVSLNIIVEIKGQARSALAEEKLNLFVCTSSDDVPAS